MTNSRPSKSNAKHKALVLGDKRKPPVRKVDVKAIPDFLKKFDRWVGWSWEWDETANKGKGKWNKPPKDARTGAPASTIDPSTWCSFDEAIAGVNEKRVDGIGFVLGKTDDGIHISGIDLDDCRNSKTGKLNELSRNIIAAMDTYCEVSPSRTGVKLLCIGTLAKGAKTKNKDGTVEIYAAGRYFTITGQRILGNTKGIEKRQQQLNRVYKSHLGEDRSKAKEPSTKGKSGHSNNGHVAQAALNALFAIRPVGNESDGSDRLMRLARQVVCHDLCDETAIKAIRAYEMFHPFPTSYSDDEIVKRIRDAEGRSKRGAAVVASSDCEPYKPFPTVALPEPLRELVENGSKAIGCDPAYIATGVLAVCATAIGNSRSVQLKKGWKEPSIVWAAGVGTSGTGKSPGIELALAPVHKLQQAAIDKHKVEMEEYEAELEAYETMKKNPGSDDDPPEKPHKPVATRYMVSDVTMEALATLLEASPHGLLMCRDELSGWYASFDKYASGGGLTSSDAAHWLSFFGARPTIVDRKTGTKTTIYLPSPSVSVTGGIQPGILKRALGKEHRENGLAARLLLAFPPVRTKQWTDAEVSEKVANEYFKVVEFLYGLKQEKCADGTYQPYTLSLSKEAKALFVEFYNSHSKEAAAETDDVAAAYWKLEGYAARLALIIHCVRSTNASTVSLKIDKTSMEQALELVKWFKQEARRVYNMLDADEDQIARQRLLDFISQRDGSISVRELQQGSRRFNTSEEAEEALNELQAIGLGEWVTKKTTGKGGRPTSIFRLNPGSTSTKPANSA